MNVFNRIIMVILMLVIIVSAIVIGVNIFTDLFDWQDIADRIINFTQDTKSYIVTLILAAILVAALIVLIFEFYRRRLKLANISTDQSGKSMIALKTIAGQISDSLKDLEDVVDPRVRIILKHNGIIINSFSKLTKGIDVNDKTKEIRDAASGFASKTLGFKVISSNYTAAGFVPKKKTKLKDIKKEAVEKTQEEIKKQKESLEE